MGKHRIITMTDQPPIRIDKYEWHLIASASGDSYGGADLGRHDQAVARGEVDRYFIGVRQHADGRRIVYGVLDAAAAAWGEPAGGVDRRHGVIVPPDGDVVRAIRQVGRECGLPDRLIGACIADLPPREI